MENLEKVLEPIRHSPRLIEAVKMLQAQIQEEKERRQRFYEEMTSEEKVEFIDGEVILHSPARKVHLDVSARLLQLLRLYVTAKNLGHVFSEKCLCVFPRNDYEPDIVFFSAGRGRGLTGSTLKFPIPDLAVEILSDSTRERDRGVKFEDYAARGVREYWLVDPEVKTIEQCVLEGGRYVEVQPSKGATLTSRVIQGFAMPGLAAFDDQVNMKAIQELVAP